MIAEDPAAEPFAPPLLCVVESGDRWQIAWRRFAPVINRRKFQISQRLIVQPVSMDEAIEFDFLDSLPSVCAVFWDLQLDRFAPLVSRLVTTSQSHRRSIQFAAVGGLSAVQIAMLTELGVSGTTVGPEGLPRLGRLVQRFAD